MSKLAGKLLKVQTAVRAALPHAKIALALVIAQEADKEYKHKANVQKALRGAATVLTVAEKLL